MEPLAAAGDDERSRSDERDDLLRSAEAHRNAAQIALFADDLWSARRHLRAARSAEQAAEDLSHRP